VAQGDPWWAWLALKVDRPRRRPGPLFWRLYIVVGSIVVFALVVWVEHANHPHHISWTRALVLAIGPTAICVVMLLFLYRHSKQPGDQ